MADLANFIKSVPLFKSLDSGDLKAVADGMGKEKIAAGTTIFRQGDTGDAFYVVMEGQCNVLVKPTDFIKVADEIKLMSELTFAGKIVPPGTVCKVDKYDPSRDYPYTVKVHGTGQRGRVLPTEIELVSGNPEDKKVATLKPGDYFGEQSLLKGAPRNATIVTDSDCLLAVLDSKKFLEIKLGEKLSFAKRKAVQTFDSEAADAANRDTTKNADDVKLIKAAILSNKKLTEMVPLGEEQLDMLAACAFRKETTAGEAVISQGDIAANEFFIVANGEFPVSVSASGSAENKASDSQVVGTIKAGMSFGELALLYQAPRAATVTSAGKGLLWVVDRYNFKNILKEAGEARTKEFIKILDSIELFNCLLSEEKEQLANALTETQFLKGEVIIKEGEEGDAFYILSKGQVSFAKGGKEIALMDAAKPEKGSKGCYFGERSLLKKEPRAATATVVSDEATALALTKSKFEELLGSLEDLIKKGANKESRAKKSAGTQRKLENIKMSDLKRLGLLGCGGFGAVTLEQHKTTGQTYALKMLSKGFIVKTKMQASVKREKEILAMCDSDFVIKLSATFKDDQHLYFLLEPALGGELYATYHKYRFHGDVKKAKYYSASVVFCFDHLHQRNILYRDLKPENLLLDDKGNCKITDMGLAKVVIGKTYTTCGTPDYFAPEVIQQTGMGKGVDWWTLGVLTHELMSGHAPFEANDPMETYQKIVRGVNRVRFTYKDADAQDLVKQMLRHQPSERLPMRVGGVKNVKSHKWYAGFEWDKLFSRGLEPPYKPNVKGPTDLANFRANEADLPPQIPYKDDGSGWDADF